MRIQITLIAESAERAHDIINRLHKPKTWVDDVNARRQAEGRPLPDETPVDKPRANVSPGESSITKVGGKSKEHIFDLLDKGLQPSGSFDEHLKLLWSRGEIKFDGEKYYR